MKAHDCHAATSEHPRSPVLAELDDDERAAAELALCASEAFMMCEFYRRPTRGQIPIAAVVQDSPEANEPRTWELVGHCLCGRTSLMARTTAAAGDERDPRIVSLWFRLMLGLDLAYRDPGLWLCKAPRCEEIFSGIGAAELAGLREHNASPNAPERAPWTGPTSKTDPPRRP